MTRELPLIIIGGVAFYVDVNKEEFREYGHQENIISFNHLQGAGDHYTLDFDKATKKVYIPGNGDGNTDNRCIVTIPAIVKLDPVGLAHKLGKATNLIMSMKDDTEW